MDYMEIPAQFKTLLIKLKPVLLTLGLWLWYFVTTLLLVVGLVCFGLEDGAILGWILLVLTLSSLVFLLKQRRKVLHFFSILLLHSFVAVLLAFLSYRYLNIDENGAWQLGLVVFFNLLALYLLKKCKSRWAKTLSALLLIVVIAGDLVLAGGPKVWATDFRIGIFIGIFTIGVGIYLVFRKGILSRLYGVGVVILAVVAIVISVVLSTQLVGMTGDDRDRVLDYTMPQIENLLSGWNEGSYEKFSADFDEGFKEQIDEAAFMEIRQAWGEYVSRGEPQVASQNIYQKLVIYIAQFVEIPHAELVFAFAESPTDSWKIVGLSLNPVEPVEEVPVD